MPIYEKVKDSIFFKKFNIIDGREIFVNYVLLIQEEAEVLEFKFDKFKRVSDFEIRDQEQNWVAGIANQELELKEPCEQNE